MRRSITVAAVALAASALPLQAQQRAAPQPCGEACTNPIAYIGMRADGPGTGITAVRLDPATGKLTSLGVAAEVVRPTWVIPSPHRPMIYSVSETGNDGKTQAGVYSFAADRASGKLTQVARVNSGGGGATHLYLNDKGTPSILVANYGTGQVAAIPLGQGGMLAEPVSVVTDVGSGPHPRQKSAHAHGVIVDPSGRFVLVADLGADKVFIYRYDAATMKLTPSSPDAVAAKPGSGPRHLVFSANGRFLYVNSELSGEITSYRWDAAKGVLTPLRTISALPQGYTGEKSAGELWASRDGRFVYVTNRGEDTIVAYAADAATGALTEVQRIASGGKQPWGVGTDPTGRWLVVGNEASDLLTVFKVDAASGKLTATGQTLSVPHPSSVAFLQR